MGIATGRSTRTVALAGNPNTGKSTVFNNLTGLRQRVGNWPGTTVSRREGGFAFGDHTYLLVDLPGCYSLFARGQEEDVARDFLMLGEPDVTVVVVDASRLHRHLSLALQVLEFTDGLVLAVNLMDEAERDGLRLDLRHLARELGVPVVGMAARHKRGMTELLQAIDQVASREDAPGRRRVDGLPKTVRRAVDELAAEIGRRFPRVRHRRWVALKLLEGDADLAGAVRDGTLGQQLPEGRGGPRTLRVPA
jgi:GTPase